MMQNSKKYLIVVCGPTAVGKTSVGIRLARHFNTEVVSADSRQFFAEMSIGTAKPIDAELDLIKHHFIGHISIEQDYNAGKYEADALLKLSELFATKQTVILVGGSGLYINALCNGMDEIPETTASIRNLLNAKYKSEGLQPLLAQLESLDKAYFDEVDHSNHIRIIRALEVCLSTGIPFSSFRKKQKKKRDFEIIKIGLTLKRELLYERINERVNQMLKLGLEDEVKALHSKKELNALQTVGYSELFDYFDRQISFEQAVDLIKQHTRNFAKRQMTWFNKDTDIQWFEPSEIDDIIHFIYSKTAI
ncbi:MAG: tRNA (adenosine(37)-N6)-dimethylallyltransferase MiaA [Cytophagales bacterium]